jgi:hypothetical protein
MADEELWCVVPHTENKYEISSFGNFRKLIKVCTHLGWVRTYKPVKLYKQNGYYMVFFTNIGALNRFQIHRLVANQFVPNPNNYNVVNHINGIKTDNRAINLEWVTQLQNICHAKSMGLLDKRISKKMVLEIRKRFNNGESVNLLAAEYGIKNIQVYDIGTGKFKAHIK